MEQWINLAPERKSSPLLAGSKARTSGLGDLDSGPGWTLQQALHGTRLTGSVSSLEARYVKLCDMPTWALSESQQTLLTVKFADENEAMDISVSAASLMVAAPVWRTGLNRAALSKRLAQGNSVAQP